MLDDLWLPPERMPLTRLGDDGDRNAERAVQSRQHARVAGLGLSCESTETVEAAKPVALQGTEDDAKGAASVLGPTVAALGLEQELIAVERGVMRAISSVSSRQRYKRRRVSSTRSTSVLKTFERSTKRDAVLRIHTHARVLHCLNESKESVVHAERFTDGHDAGSQGLAMRTHRCVVERQQVKYDFVKGLIGGPLGMYSSCAASMRSASFAVSGSAVSCSASIET